jgi:hypothetical protein
MSNNPVLNVSGTTNYQIGTTAKILAPALNINDPDGGTLDGAKVIITNKLSGDVLSVAGQTATSGTIEGLTWNYDPTKGILTLSGDADNSVYERVLRQITYSNTSGTPDTTSRDVKFILGSKFVNPENGHLYEFVNSPDVTWTTAKSGAEGKNYLGLQGYLVTITSSGEQLFVQANADVQGNAWIGASDAVGEGQWSWVTGPEAGTQFWSGSNSGSAVEGRYNNWSASEPNNLTAVDPKGEQYAHLIAAPLNNLLGEWNDLPDSGATGGYSLRGYVVEYGGLSGESPLSITGDVKVNLTNVSTNPNNPGTDFGNKSNSPDFDGDDKPEILWRSFSTGDNEIWTVNYDANNTNNPFSIAPITPLRQLTDTNWKAEGIEDYNRDGIDDILWRNPNSGENVIWLMKNGSNGIEFDREVAIAPLIGSEWEIEDVDDFTGDGFKEILWRNNETGQNAIWEVLFDQTNTTQPLSVDSPNSKFIAPVTDTSWRIQGSGDFNNDNIADIVWQEEGTGKNAIWLLKNENGGAGPTVDKGYFLNTVDDKNWTIEGVADFNQDGNDDLLWRNYQTGQNAIWLMTDESSLGSEIVGDPGLTVVWQQNSSEGDNGPTLSAGQGLLLIETQPDLQWDIEGVADFTGDNIPDILWRNYGTGENAIWRMSLDGTAVSVDQSFSILGKDVSWQVQAPTPNNDYISSV